MLLSELWVGDVKTKKHPPEGLFATGSATEIIKWLKKTHGGDLAGAMEALNFYVNRAGKKLSTERKSTFDQAKNDLQKD